MAEHTSPATLDIRPVTTDQAWLEVKAIRQRVFVEEQACPPEEEWDAHDWDGAEADALHVLGYRDGRPVATARWRVVSWEGRPAAKLERFAVLAEHRGEGHGRRLVAHLLEQARRAGHSVFVLNAQAYLEDFYASFGFVPTGERFIEAGIPHLRMVRREPPNAARGSNPASYGAL